MKNLYLFEKEQSLSKRQMMFFILESLAYILLSLIVLVISLFFYDLLFLMFVLLIPLLVIGKFCYTLKIINEKCYTVQLEPGGIKYKDDKGRLRFIPVEKIECIKQVRIKNIVKDKESNMDIWLAIYRIQLCSGPYRKEIRFKQYWEDGRKFNFKLGDGVVERSEQLLEQVKKLLDRSDEFMAYIGLTLDENKTKI